MTEIGDLILHLFVMFNSTVGPWPCVPVDAAMPRAAHSPGAAGAPDKRDVPTAGTLGGMFGEFEPSPPNR